VSQTKADAVYIRRALEKADLNAVKLTLFHITRDEAYAALPVAAKMDDRQRAWLLDRATAWLEKNQGPGTLPEPPDAELRRMMDMVAGGKMGDLEFEARRDLTGFKPFPYMAEWEGKKPRIPEGFMVAIIGSGFAGITAGIQLEQLGIPYTLFERRPEPGGVWSINRYPDVRVDTISITYEFLFEREHTWSEYFGRGPEVRSYLRYVSEKYGVFKNSRFNHDLKRATFDEKRDLWTLELDTPEGPKTVEVNAVISGAGLFATPKIVDFPAKDTFKGRIVHTARWDDNLDLKGKRVAVIGNGSTGVQLLSAVAREAKHVSVFQRTPQWVSPRDKYGLPVEPEINWLVKNFRGYRDWWRYCQTAALFETHALMTVDPEWQAKGGKVNQQSDAMRDVLIEYIKQETGGRQDLIDKLIPDYAPFSRRPVVDNGWYRALARDNVELVTDGIKRFVPEGIETADGKIRECDVIITATGFDIIQYLAPSQYIGRGGADLHDRWTKGDGPRAYIGIMVPDFPNMFMIYGPNSQPVSGGPAQPVWHSTWVAFSAKCIMRMLQEGKTRVEVKKDAYERYNVALDQEARKLIQMSKEGGIEKNYYVNRAYNRLRVNAPWYSPYYYRLCNDVGDDVLEITNGSGQRHGAVMERERQPA
jgi:4-hydroxyacetophenone monooxygenase